MTWSMEAVPGSGMVVLVATGITLIPKRLAMKSVLIQWENM